ncbi:MAG: hypothetical protein Q8928_05625 [Bacteroidota bacterium]|nr:hypothetical protein [Bacteroidota bacterium]
MKKGILSILVIIGFVQICGAECIIELRKQSLKYTLIDVASSVYLANVAKPPFYSVNSFKQFGVDGINYYNWLIAVYVSLPEDKKLDLKTIFENNSARYLMTFTMPLNDSASVDQIVGKLSGSMFMINRKSRKAIRDFFPYFYNNCLQSYLPYIDKAITKNYISVKNDLRKYNLNIFEFMNINSGLHVLNGQKQIVYYSPDFFATYGFTHNNEEISVVTRVKDNFPSLLKTIFHENSHVIFQTFTKSSEFEKLVEPLKQNKELFNLWNNNLQNTYKLWSTWCEENLVNGFAFYLFDKYTGEKTYYTGNYYFDYQFYKYLKNNRFNPSETTLKAMTYQFINDLNK